MAGGELYIIHYPLTRDANGVWGGPMCIMTGSKIPAYPAFHSYNLAEVFRRRAGSPESYRIIRIGELGPQYPELVKGVTQLLLFTSAKVVESYFRARRNQQDFPYGSYLVDRPDVGEPQNVTS
jgi:hypothetical protein